MINTLASINSHAQPSPIPVVQEVNTTTNNIVNAILLGRPAICFVKRLADDMAKKDAEFDKNLEITRKQEKVINNLELTLSETKKLVETLKTEIAVRDNRDLLRKEYEDKLLDLVKKQKEVESSKWSRTTYFLLGDFAGILKGLGAALLYNKLVK
jgi:hypothetical protein